MSNITYTYTPSQCDLCGSASFTSLMEIMTGQAILSDGRIVHANLSKLECSQCGLVRSGESFSDLKHYYANSYTVSEQFEEHYFYTPSGTISRSYTLCDWLTSLEGARWQTASRVLEIGAGSGLLLEEFAHRFPSTHFEGIELGASAVAQATLRGLQVTQRSLEELEPQSYDIIFAVAVLEHVASPSHFLRSIRRLLKSGGQLFLCQPTQDVISYDLFLLDHLHHFGTDHLRQYAAKIGYVERAYLVGHYLMPNFSLHMWQHLDTLDEQQWTGSFSPTSCVQTASTIQADFNRLNILLRKLSAERRQIAVFGLREAYRLILAYSELSQYKIEFGLDDNPHSPEFTHLNFPILIPEDAHRLSAQDVLLTMNKLYYPLAIKRMMALGLVPHPIFS